MAKRAEVAWDSEAWLKDANLRSVSYAARGLWIDMCSLMYTLDRTGFLQLNGTPLTHEQLARMTGGSSEEVSRLLTELLRSGVASTTERGTIYCRRIVKAETKREKCREAGFTGGNPTLKGVSKGHSKGPPKGAPRESVSIPSSLNFEDFVSAWMDWISYRTQSSLTLSDVTLKGQMAQCEAWGREKSIRCIRESILRAWRSLYEPRNGSVVAKSTDERLRATNARMAASRASNAQQTANGAGLQNFDIKAATDALVKRVSNG